MCCLHCMGLRRLMIGWIYYWHVRLQRNHRFVYHCCTRTMQWDRSKIRTIHFRGFHKRFQHWWCGTDTTDDKRVPYSRTHLNWLRCFGRNLCLLTKWILNNLLPNSMALTYNKQPLPRKHFLNGTEQKIGVAWRCRLELKHFFVSSNIGKPNKQSSNWAMQHICTVPNT